MASSDRFLCVSTHLKFRLKQAKWCAVGVTGAEGASMYDAPPGASMYDEPAPSGGDGSGFNFIAGNGTEAVAQESTGGLGFIAGAEETAPVTDGGGFSFISGGDVPAPAPPLADDAPASAFGFIG